MRGLDPLFAALTVAARRLGEARAEALRLARRDPTRAWRSARLVWPLFPKG